MKKVIILGAGISGLTVAWELKKKYGSQVDLTLVEKSDRVGGWIKSLQHEDFLFELGPRGFRPVETTLTLIRELDLEKELISANAHAKKRYLSLNHSLHQISPLFLLKQGLLPALLKDLVAPKRTQEDASIYDFFSSRLGPFLTESLIDPVVKGIYGGNYKNLSMRSCFPNLWNAQHSLLTTFLKQKKVKTPLCSFKKGMETLPKELAKKLEAKILLSTEALQIEERGVATRSHFLEADHIISTLPGYALAKIIPGFKDWLSYVTLSVVNLGWREDVLPKRGFGFLVPEKEKGDILGMTWDSDIFPVQNLGTQTRLCVMISGEHSKERLKKIALKNVAHYLDIHKPPEALLTYTAHRAIPQYPLGHFRQLEMLPKHISILGNSFYGVSINECIRQSQRLNEIDHF